MQKGRTGLCSKAPAWVTRQVVQEKERERGRDGGGSGSQFPPKCSALPGNIGTGKSGEAQGRGNKRGKLDPVKSISCPPAKSEGQRDWNWKWEWQGQQGWSEGWQEKWGGNWNNEWWRKGGKWDTSPQGADDFQGGAESEVEGSDEEDPNSESEPSAKGKVDSTKRKKKRKNLRKSLRGMGPPRFSEKGRALFLKAVELAPSKLRGRVAKEVLDHPDFSSRQMNRHLYNKWGAKVWELNPLFGCEGMLEIMEKVKRRYRRKEKQPERGERPASSGGE